MHRLNLRSGVLDLKNLMRRESKAEKLGLRDRLLFVNLMRRELKVSEDSYALQELGGLESHEERIERCSRPISGSLRAYVNLMRRELKAFSLGGLNVGCGRNLMRRELKDTATLTFLPVIPIPSNLMRRELKVVGDKLLGAIGRIGNLMRRELKGRFSLIV